MEIEIVTDIAVAEKTVKRLLKRVQSEPIEIYPGYYYGLVLPSDVHVSIITPISQILPLCKIDDTADIFASFMVFPKDSFTSMFEISFKKSGRYLYKNNKKFENPPEFDTLFNTVRGIYRNYLCDLVKNKANNINSDVLAYYYQTLILNRLNGEKSTRE